MKRTATVVIAMLALIAAVADNSNSKSWKPRYGISELCDNPIFIQPLYFGPEPGQLAGVNNDESAAFGNRFVELSPDWHFAPKMELCQQERDRLAHILGYHSSATGNFDRRAVLKVSVNPIDGCGAMVVYRVYGGQGNDSPEQVLTIYDGEANLLDAITLGKQTEMETVAAVTPHGPYTPGREESQVIKIDEEAKTFIFSRGIGYKYPKDGREQFEIGAIEYHYVTDPFGKITLKRKESDKAPSGINADALALMELRQQPLSVNILPKLLAGAKYFKNEALKPLYCDLVAREFVRNPQAFAKFVYANRAKAKVLLDALKVSNDTFNSDFAPHISQEALADIVEQLPAAQRAYFAKQLQL